MTKRLTFKTLMAIVTRKTCLRARYGTVRNISSISINRLARCYYIKTK